MVSNRLLCRAIAGFLLGFATAAAGAQAAPQGNAEGVASWWPDVQYGIIWTGSAVGAWKDSQLNYDRAVQSCNTLMLSGMSGWRLPTIGELDGILVPYSGEVVVQDSHGEFHDTGRAVGGLAPRLDSEKGDWFWSSTAGPGDTILTERNGGGHAVAKRDAHISHAAFCVRTMEPEIADIARQAQPPQPVGSLQELRNIVPVRQAYEAYQKQDYAASLADAQAALVLSPHSPEAVYAEALSQAGLGHWDDAIAGFTRLKGMDWGSMKTEIAWAKNNKKAAASGTPLDPKKNITPSWTFANPRP